MGFPCVITKRNSDKTLNIRFLPRRYLLFWHALDPKLTLRSDRFEDGFTEDNVPADEVRCRVTDSFASKPLRLIFRHLSLSFKIEELAVAKGQKKPLDLRRKRSFRVDTATVPAATEGV